MDFKDEQLAFYLECLSELQARHGDAKYYLPVLQRYVFVTYEAERLAKELAEESATIEHTNKAGHTNPASSPKVRMFALYSEQATKLAATLGLNLVAPKVGRKAKTKKGFELTKPALRIVK